MRTRFVSIILTGLAVIAFGAHTAEADDAYFAAGCFWCIQPPFDSTPGVTRTVVGYMGGTAANPTYDQVSTGTTGHKESIKIVFDPSKVTYEELLDIFWKNVDPTNKEGQFCDLGTQYGSAVFYGNESQKLAAEASKAKILADGRISNIATEILPAGPFYDAEDYHQAFYKKNPDRYYQYKTQCRRDARLKEVWGDAKTDSSPSH